MVKERANQETWCLINITLYKLTPYQYKTVSAHVLSVQWKVNRSGFSEIHAVLGIFMCDVLPCLWWVNADIAHPARGSERIHACAGHWELCSARQKPEILWQKFLFPSCILSHQQNLQAKSISSSSPQGSVLVPGQSILWVCIGNSNLHVHLTYKKRTLLWQVF